MITMRMRIPPCWLVMVNVARNVRMVAVAVVVEIIISSFVVPMSWPLVDIDYKCVAIVPIRDKLVVVHHWWWWWWWYPNHRWWF